MSRFFNHRSKSSCSNSLLCGARCGVTLCEVYVQCALTTFSIVTVWRVRVSVSVSIRRLRSGALPLPSPIAWIVRACHTCSTLILGAIPYAYRPIAIRGAVSMYKLDNVSQHISTLMTSKFENREGEAAQLYVRSCGPRGYGRSRHNLLFKGESKE